MATKVQVVAPAAMPASAASLLLVERLSQAMAGRRAWDGGSDPLDWFGHCHGAPMVPVAKEPLAALVRRHATGLLRLLRCRQPRLRQAAVYALSVAGHPHTVPACRALLMRQLDDADHDYAYVAVRRLGRAGVAALAAWAAAASGRERSLAVDCLGKSRGGRAALAAIRQVVIRHGYVPGVLSALYNLQEPAGIRLALGGLSLADPGHRLDAVMAIDSLARRLGARPSATRRQVVAAIEALFAEPRVWSADGDPWISTFSSGLTALAQLDRRACRRVLALARGRSLDADRRSEVAEVRLRLRRPARSR